MKKNILLIISIILVLASFALFGYLYISNQKMKDEVKTSQDNIKKVETAIKDDQKELEEKEDEYEKLQETVKESMEELNIWEEMKAELNKSLS